MEGHIYNIFAFRNGKNACVYGKHAFLKVQHARMRAMQEWMGEQLKSTNITCGADW